MFRKLCVTQLLLPVTLHPSPYFLTYYPCFSKKSLNRHQKTTILKFLFERVGGIEPPAPVWKTGVLPLYDTRLFN